MFKPVSFGIALALLVASPAMAQTPEQGGSAYQRGDYAAALKETWPQATRGNAEAQNNLGLMYYRGHGLPQDRAEAASWFRMAAEQGHVRAEYNLGLAYHRGEGVPQNSAEAFKWFLKAAEQGNAKAQNNVAVMYHRGDGVEKDAAEALKWFRKAADQGHARARTNLGAISEAGGDVAQETPPESSPESSSETPSKSPPKSLPEISRQVRLAPVGEDFRVQLGAFRSRDLAENEARRLNGIHKPALGDLTISADRADLGRRGVFYRLRAGSFKDRAAAKDFCRKLLGKNQSCIVVRP